MTRDVWYKSVTLSGSNLSIAQRILLYLFTLKSCESLEGIPLDEERTIKAIHEAVGGSLPGVVKVLRRLTQGDGDNHRSRTLGSALIIKTRPKHGRGRLPGSPPFYFSLTRSGEAEAKKLAGTIEFDIELDAEEASVKKRGNFQDILIIFQNGNKYGSSAEPNEKRVIQALVGKGAFSFVQIERERLVNTIVVESSELNFGEGIVLSTLQDMSLLALEAKEKMTSLLGKDGFNIEQIDELKYLMTLRTVGFEGKVWVEGVRSEFPEVTKFRISASYLDKRYHGWVDIGTEERGTGGTRLTANVYADDPWTVMELRSLPVISDFVEKIALEILKNACRKKELAI